MTASIGADASASASPGPEGPGHQATSDPAEIDRLLARAAEVRLAGDLAEMERLSNEALAMSRRAGDGHRVARSLYSLSSVYFMLSRVGEALGVMREALPLAEAAGDRLLQAKLRNGIGLCLRETGEFDAAIDELLSALAIDRELGDRVEQSRILRNVATLYLMLGEYDVALEHARQAQALAAATDDRLVQKISLQILGATQALAGAPDLGVATLHRSMAVQLPTPIAALDMETLGNLAYVEFGRGRYQEALAAGLRAFEADSGASYPMGRAAIETCLGASAYELGRTDEALRWLLQARGELKALGDSVHATWIIENERWIARVLRGQGNRDEALAVDLRLLDGIDRMLSRAQVDAVSMATATSRVSDVYVDTIDLLFELGRVDEAFDVSERYHARSFLRTLAESKDEASGGALGAEQRARHARLAAETSRVQKQLWDADLPAARREELTRELAALDAEADAMRREIRRTSPSYASVRYPELARVSGALAELAEGTTLLSYTLGDKRSFVWALSKKGVAAALLPSRGDIESKVSAYVKLLSTRPAAMSPASRATAIRSAGQALYRQLIAPVGRTLAGATRLVIVPDGELHALPFETLVMPADAKPAAAAGGVAWLGSAFRVTEAPSASAWRTIGRAAERTSTTPRQLLAFGDPAYGPDVRLAGGAGDATRSTGVVPALQLTALPFSRVEVVDIASLYPASSRQIYLGHEAREELVKSLPLNRYGHIHFAAHAYINDSRPSRSGIALSMDPRSKEDGMLQAVEVAGLRLDADVVTLSACSTGRGRLVRGEGVLGLAQAFLAAGARSVVASLWNVSDAATPALMRGFYEQLNRGAAPDEALRRAKAKLMQSADPSVNDPYYWAPFVVIGR